MFPPYLAGMKAREASVREQVDGREMTLERSDPPQRGRKLAPF